MRAVEYRKALEVRKQQAAGEAQQQTRWAVQSRKQQLEGVPVSPPEVVAQRWTPVALKVWYLVSLMVAPARQAVEADTRQHRVQTVQLREV